MIHLMITTKVLPGKMAQAQDILQQVVDYMCTNTPEQSYQIIRNVHGNTRTIHALASYHTIADWDAARTTRATDPKWQAIVAELHQVVDLHNAQANFYEVIIQSTTE